MGVRILVDCSRHLRCLAAIGISLLGRFDVFCNLACIILQLFFFFHFYFCLRFSLCTSSIGTLVNRIGQVSVRFRFCFRVSSVTPR